MEYLLEKYAVGRDLQGKPLFYICKCGFVFWPWITNLGQGRTEFMECPCGGEGVDRNYSESRSPPKIKYRKPAHGQIHLSGNPVKWMGRPV